MVTAFLNGGVGISDQDMSEIMKYVSDENRRVMKLTRETLAELKGQKTDIKLVNDYIKKKMEQEIRTAKYEERKADINHVGVFSENVSSVVAIFNPRVGQALGVSTSATIKIAGAINDLSLGNLSNLGMLAATGDIIGAIGNIAAMILGGGPSIDQIILEQVQELRKELAQMREEMHGRFDAIDLKLKNIYDEMLVQFDKLSQSQQLTRAEITLIQENLLRLHNDVKYLDQKVSKLFKDLAQRPLSDLFAECFERNVADIAGLSDEQYGVCLRKFAVCAIEHSSDSIEVGFSTKLDAQALHQRDVFVRLGEDLKQKSLYESLGTLTELSAAVKGAEPERIANLSTWAKCTDAYVRIARVWPHYYKHMPFEQTRKMYRFAERLENQLSTVTGDGAFFERYIDLAIRPRVADLLASIKERRERYQKDNLAGYDIRLGLDQSPNATAENPNAHRFINYDNIPACPDNVGGYKYNAYHGADKHRVTLRPMGGDPKAIDSLISPMAKMQYFMSGANGVIVCWDQAEFVEDEIRWKIPQAPNGLMKFPFFGDKLLPVDNDLQQWGKARIHVSVFLNGKRVFRRAVTASEKIQYGMQAWVGGGVKFGNDDPGFGGNHRRLFEEMPRSWDGETAKTILTSGADESGEEIKTRNDEIKADLERKFAESRTDLTKILTQASQGAAEAKISESLTALEGAVIALKSLLLLNLNHDANRNDVLSYLIAGRDGIFNRQSFRLFLEKSKEDKTVMPYDEVFIAAHLNERVELLSELLAELAVNKTSLDLDPVFINQKREIDRLVDNHFILAPRISIDEAISNIKERVDQIMKDK